MSSRETVLPDDIRELLAHLEAELGFVPAIADVLAGRPSFMRAWVAMIDDLLTAAPGPTPVQREMIGVVVSATNRCHYCVTSHGAALRRLIQDPLLVNTLATNYRAATLPEKERAMLDFAVALTEHPEAAERTALDVLVEAGWTEEEVYVIVAVASFFNMSNRFASALGLVPNPEYSSIGRGGE